MIFKLDKCFLFCISIVLFLNCMISNFINAASIDGLKKAIIIGASSGIGRELAVELSAKGYEVGLVARRTNKLKDLQAKLTYKSYIKTVDISKTTNAIVLVKELIAEMQGCDLFIVNAGVGFNDEELDWSLEEEMLAVNVVGFTAMVNVAVDHFMQIGYGHLVGITSVIGVRASKAACIYSATKAYDSFLLQGIRAFVRSKKLPIYVTDIKPGFVDTAMVQEQKRKFWQASPSCAALQICKAINAKKEEAYVTKRWRIISWLLYYAPNWLLNRVM